MADPRSTNTRRVVLSYDQLKKLTRDAGNIWPDLLIKDYQGIIQDFTFLADETDALELRVIQNELDIDDLQLRVEALEYRVFEIVEVTADFTTEEFQIVICKNTTPIEVELKPTAIKGDEVRVKRRGAKVKIIGLINGKQNLIINVKNAAPLLVFDGTDWSTI